MNILIISNMAPSDEAPHAGMFVINQVKALRGATPADWTIDFAAMPRRVTGRFGSVWKYAKFGSYILRKFFFRTKYDIIHIHYFFPTILFGILYKWIRNRRAHIVVTFHGSDIYSLKEDALYRFFLKRVNWAIPVSHGLESRLGERGFPPSKTTVVPAGILPVYAKDMARAGNAYDLIYVGALIPIKGFDLFLETLKSFSGVRICVIGTGPLLNALGEDIRKRHSITHCAAVDPAELASLFGRSRYLVSTSRNEAFGLVMAEAMATGTPVIATRTDGSLEQIRHGENGFLIDGESDLERIANGATTIRGALDVPPDEYHRLSDGAARLVDTFRLENVAAEVISIYQDLISS